jgi:integrase
LILFLDGAASQRSPSAAIARRPRRSCAGSCETLDDGSHVDPSRLTVRQWLETWLETVRSETSPKTAERYGEICRNFLMPALGNISLTRLTPPQIQTAYNAWAVGGRRDGKAGGLSLQTRRHIHRVLRTALARAVEQQLIARNPADVFKKRLPKVERRELVTLTADAAPRGPCAQSRLLACAVGPGDGYAPG